MAEPTQGVCRRWPGSGRPVGSADGELVDPPLATVVGGEGPNRCSGAVSARLCGGHRFVLVAAPLTAGAQDEAENSSEQRLARRRRHAGRVAGGAGVHVHPRARRRPRAHRRRLVRHPTAEHRRPADRATTTSASSRSRSSPRCRAAGAPWRGPCVTSSTRPITDGRFAFSVQNDPAPTETEPAAETPTDDDRAGGRGRHGPQRRPGQHRRGRVARPGAVDARHPGHLRRARADRRRLARGARVRDHRPVPALDVGAGADRHRAVPRGVHRRRDRSLTRRLAQPVGVVRPRRCRLAGAGGDRPARPRHRHRLGRDASGARHRPDDTAARVRHPVARHRGRRAEPDGRRLAR